MSEEKERTHDISQGYWESGEGVYEREVSTLLMPPVSLTRTLNEFPITENIVTKDHRTRTRSVGCSACCPGL